MTKPPQRVNRAATERLILLVRAELERRDLTAEEIAREARLPSKAFRSLLRHGHRPLLDRADEICKALGVSMRIGVNTPNSGKGRSQETNQQKVAQKASRD